MARNRTKKTTKRLTKTMKPKAKRPAVKAKAATPKAAPLPKGPLAVEVQKLDADGQVIKIGSGRKTVYRGKLKLLPGKGRRLIVERTDSHKQRIFKTSKVTLVTKDKTDPRVRHIRTEHGSRYLLRVV